MSKKAPWTTMPQYLKPVEEKKRKPIPRVSKKLSAEKRIYNREVKVWLTLAENKYCAACRRAFDRWPYHASQCHHTHGRRKALLLYKPWWMPVCDQCHKWIHKNIEEAIRLGLRCPKGEWEKQPPQENL